MNRVRIVFVESDTSALSIFQRLPAESADDIDNLLKDERREERRQWRREDRARNKQNRRKRI